MTGCWQLLSEAKGLPGKLENHELASLGMDRERAEQTNASLTLPSVGLWFCGGGGHHSYQAHSFLYDGV